MATYYTQATGNSIDADGKTWNHRLKVDYTITNNGATATIKVTLTPQVYTNAPAGSKSKIILLYAWDETAKKDIIADQMNYWTTVKSANTWSDLNKSYSGTLTVAEGTSAANHSIEVYSSVSDRYEYPVYGSQDAVDIRNYSIPAKLSYTITFNANSGSGQPGNQTKWYGTNLTLSSTKPTRSNYSFYHWNTNTSNTGTSYNAGGTYSANAAATLYAIWNPIIYFNANSGSGAPGNQTKTFGSALTLSSTKPTRTNYSFYHWNTNTSNTGTSYNAGGSVAAGTNTSFTLYAIWNPIISFDANGGSGAPSSQTKTFGSALTLNSTKPTRTNYSFYHWNTNTSNTGTSYNAGASYNPDNTARTLYAIWNPIISFDANGGSGAPSAQTKTFGSALTLSSTKPTRTGYNFLGWATSSTATTAAYSAGGSYNPDNTARTLYAVWQLITYSVSYNANGGSGAPSAQTKTHGTDLTLSSITPTRTNFSFAGWNTAADGSGTAYSAGGTYTTEAAVTLYAQWTRVYIEPIVDLIRSFRSDSSGNPDDEGAYATIQIDSIAVWKNVETVTAIATVNEVSASVTVSAFNPIGDPYKYAKATVVVNAAMETDLAYDVAISVTDGTTTIDKSDNITTAFFTMDLLRGGHGVSFGSPSFIEAFNVSMPITVYDRIALPVYRYSSVPAEADLPTKPCIVACETGEVYMAYGIGGLST